MPAGTEGWFGSNRTHALIFRWGQCAWLMWLFWIHLYNFTLTWLFLFLMCELNVRTYGRSNPIIKTAFPQSPPLFLPHLPTVFSSLLSLILEEMVSPKKMASLVYLTLMLFQNLYTFISELDNVLRNIHTASRLVQMVNTLFLLQNTK